MSGFLAKLRFIHQRLWSRDTLYRWCLLLGPAPLVGTGFALLAWSGLHAVERQAPPPLWATVMQHAPVAPSTEAVTVQPWRFLPTAGSDGQPIGYNHGWHVRLSPVDISPTLDVDVKTESLSAFNIDSASVDLQQLVEKGSKSSRYAGVGMALLAIRSAGTYALTIRFRRPAGQVANCLTRLGFGHSRIVSNVGVNIVDDVSRVFPPGRFELQPGLYPVTWAFGCWHGEGMADAGRIELLIQRPDDPKLVPVSLDDILRPATAIAPRSQR